MIDRLRNIYKFLRSALFYGYFNIRYIKKNFVIKDGTYAIINVDNELRNDDYSRYFYTMCMYFDHAGFTVIVKTPWSDFDKFIVSYDYKKLILKQNYIFVRHCSTPLNTIVLVRPNTTNQIIHLSYGYDNIIQSGHFDCVAPYPMHPYQFKFHSMPAYVSELKQTARTMKIFFAGNKNEAKYVSSKVKKFFDVIGRVEIIKFIRSEFDKTTEFLQNNSYDALQKLLNSKDYRNEIVISTIKTKPEDWLKILAKTDFFICPPGVRMPWCHNCVEAMSVGAIPILQYGDLFYPHLEDSKNCLSFSNSDELKMAIERALAMKQSEIEEMRKSVVNYYNEYLSPDSIAKRIKTFSNSAQTDLRVAIPFIPTREEWLSLVPLYKKN